MSDGGEGFLDAWSGTLHEVTLPDPWGVLQQAPYRLRALGDGGTEAVVEAATVIGYRPDQPRSAASALEASSAPLGMLLSHLAELGVRRITCGVGGTATSDGGLGCFDAAGDLGAVELLAAVDVLLPYRGALNFAPQKGVAAGDLHEISLRLDVAARRFATVSHVAVDTVPGAGSGGGVGGALVALGATVASGFDVVAREHHLSEAIDDASVVITGEGRLDASSLQGKVVGAILTAAPPTTPVIIVCGSADRRTLQDLRSRQRRILVADCTESFGAAAAYGRTASCVRDLVVRSVTELETGAASD
jgi:glycerate 2-kinase